ncbi:MAG TPA: hypothetical protein DCE44_04810 [Verrucomicrobiales bacterium]|nr:hypothetical protein [Verrucomicrobiales bacterium]
MKNGNGCLMKSPKQVATSPEIIGEVHLARIRLAKAECQSPTHAPVPTSQPPEEEHSSTPYKTIT